MARLIIGLGNPGTEYELTRHNLGFLVLDALAQKLGVKFSKKNESQAEVAETNLASQKIILAKPQTFMNLSGESAASLAGRFKIEAKDIWVVHDDVALPFGVLRVRLDGSAGGHNGIKSLISSLSTENFPRWRVGVGATPEHMKLEDWVLARFGAEEQKQLAEVVERVAQKIIDALPTDLSALTQNLSE